MDDIGNYLIILYECRRKGDSAPLSSFDGRSFFEPVSKGVNIHEFAVEVNLAVVAAKIAEEGFLVGLLDTFGDDGQPELPGRETIVSISFSSLGSVGPT